MASFRTRVPRQPTSRQFAQRHRGQVRDVRGRFAGGWGVAWQNVESTAAAIDDWADDVLRNLHDKVDSIAEEIEQYMKANRPWEDRTFAAVEGLQCVVVWQDDEHFTLMLGHGEDVEYGIWLEVRWGGRFAIVVPTAEYYAPRLGAMIAGGH